MIRARADISHILLEAKSDGHCGLPRKILIKYAEELLGIPCPVIEQALELEQAGKELFEDSPDEQRLVFLAALYRAEQNIAARLRALPKGAPPWSSIDPEKAIPWVEKKLNVTLAARQQEAIRLALKSKVLVITGGPRVGKTTLVNSLLHILRVKKVEAALCAPTGRAAKRLKECCPSWSQQRSHQGGLEGEGPPCGKSRRRLAEDRQGRKCDNRISHV